MFLPSEVKTEVIFHNAIIVGRIGYVRNKEAKAFREVLPMRDIRIEFTNERIIPSGGLAVVGAILGKSDFVKKLNRMDVTKNRSQHQIKNGDILLTYIGMLCMGKPQFDAVREMEDDPEFYKYALGVAYKIPSEETLRQRMDDIGRTIRFPESKRLCIG